MGSRFSKDEDPRLDSSGEEDDSSKASSFFLYFSILKANDTVCSGFFKPLFLVILFSSKAPLRS